VVDAAGGEHAGTATHGLARYSSRKAGADTLVVPAATQAYVAAAAWRDGARIALRQWQSDTHGSIADTAVPDVLTFLRSSLAGAAPPTTC
jgi:hypothetical protein